MARRLGGEPKKERGSEREVSGRNDPDSLRPRTDVDLLVIRRREAAGADNHPDSTLDRREHVLLHGRRVRVIDKHVHRHGPQRLCDQAEACRIGRAVPGQVGEKATIILAALAETAVDDDQAEGRPRC
jgi:hypothetical protein